MPTSWAIQAFNVQVCKVCMCDQLISPQSQVRQCRRHSWNQVMPSCCPHAYHFIISVAQQSNAQCPTARVGRAKAPCRQPFRFFSSCAQPKSPRSQLYKPTCCQVPAHPDLIAHRDPPPPRVGIARTMCMYAGGGKGGRVQHPFVYSERGASPWCFLVDAIIEDLQG